MRWNKMFLFLNILFIASMHCSEYDQNKKTNARAINIDSLSIIKNMYNKDTLIDDFNQSMSGATTLEISIKMTNYSSQNMLIYTTRKKSTLFRDIQSVHIGLNKITMIPYGVTGLLVSKIDTLRTKESKKYVITYYGDIYTEYGTCFYSQIKIPVFFNFEYNYPDNNKEWKDYPYPYDKDLEQANRFLIYVDLLENTVHLVDSTFEEVLESYKRRGYIEQ
jgi:hypothetical protein